MAEAAVDFIDQKSGESNQFIANNLIYWSKSPHITTGKGKPFFLFYSFHHVHYPHFSGEQFRNSSVRGTFGDALVRYHNLTSQVSFIVHIPNLLQREVDWSVGQVMKAVRLNGHIDDTFVFFTSDNG